MGNLKEQLNVDIKRFFEQIENQNTDDQAKTLRNLLDKYIHLSKADYLMDSHDLRNIIGSAKSLFAQKTFPMFLGEKTRKVDPNDQPNLCVIEATIQHLNKNDCLKKLPKFDYREDKLKE